MLKWLQNWQKRMQNFVEVPQKSEKTYKNRSNGLFFIKITLPLRAVWGE